MYDEHIAKHFADFETWIHRVTLKIAGWVRPGDFDIEDPDSDGPYPVNRERRDLEVRIFEQPNTGASPAAYAEIVDVSDPANTQSLRHIQGRSAEDALFHARGALITDEEARRVPSEWSPLTLSEALRGGGAGPDAAWGRSDT